MVKSETSRLIKNAFDISRSCQNFPRPTFFEVPFATRIVTSSSYDAEAGCLLQQLGWKDLISQHQIQEALMVFKALNNVS